MLNRIAKVLILSVLVTMPLATHAEVESNEDSSKAQVLVASVSESGGLGLIALGLVGLGAARRVRSDAGRR